MAKSIRKPRDLQKMIVDGQPVFLLDIRRTPDYAAWKIRGDSVTSMNIPYEDLVERQDVYLARLPIEQEIVVVCYRGRSAELACGLLEEQGYRPVLLEQGMMGWGQVYCPITVAKDAAWELVQFDRLGKGCLSYMLLSEGQAMVVDPGRHVEEYVEYATSRGVKITHVMDTHLHADHISGGTALAAVTGATYHISASEMAGSPVTYSALTDGDEFTFGTVNVQVLPLPTPGHTPGSVSFLINDNYLLTGDTVFVGGLGRPDLGGKAAEWAQMLYDSIFQKIATLPDDLFILPAHYSGPHERHTNGFIGATLGTIRQQNELMRLQDRDQFTAQVSSAVGTKPGHYDRIIEINRGLSSASPEEASELENGPNKCAVKHQGV